MQFNEEEDEKISDPFIYDQQLYQGLKKVCEHKNEDILTVYTEQFLDHLLHSMSLSGVCLFLSLSHLHHRKSTSANKLRTLSISLASQTVTSFDRYHCLPLTFSSCRL